MALPTCLWRPDPDIEGNYLSIVGSSNPALGVTSFAGKNIESLPGITRQDIYAITDSDFATGKQFFQDKVKFALAELIANTTEWVMPKFRLEALLDRPLVGQYKVGAVQYYPAESVATERGIIAERQWTDDYGILDIDHVTIICNTSGSGVLTIQDNLGQINTYPFTAVAGLPIDIITRFQTEGTRVTITTDANVILQGKTNVNNRCNSCGEVSGKQWRIRGWDGSNYANDTFGLLAQMAYRCDQSQISCMFTNVEAFQQAALYTLGECLMNEWSRPERANPKTLRTEKAMSLMEEFKDRKERRLENLRETVTVMMARPRSGCISSNATRFTLSPGRVTGSWR